MKALRCQICLLIILLVFCFDGYAQSDSLKIDSLKKVVLTEKEDTNKVNTLIEIGSAYKNNGVNYQSLLYYFDALKLAENTGDKESSFRVLYTIADFYMDQFDNDNALEYALKAQQIAEQQNNTDNLYKIYDLIGGFIYFNEGNYIESLQYGNKMMKIAIESNDKEKIRYMEGLFGEFYRLVKKFDSSAIMYKKALAIATALGNNQAIADCLNGIGMAYGGKNNFREEINYYMQAIRFSNKEGLFTGFYLPNIAEAYFHMNRYDSAVFYAKLFLDLFKDSHSNWVKSDVYELLSKTYAAKGNYKEAYANHLKFSELKDSIGSIKSTNRMNAIQNNYRTEKQTKEIALQKKQGEINLLTKDKNLAEVIMKSQATVKNFFIGFTLVVLIAAFLLYNNRKNKKAKTKIEAAYAELKSTQAQLIQSEKMASLGELTAGIAHEIQNPLNFVNNFSEVNKELIDEMNEEMDKGNIKEAKSIASDLQQNLEKINHHGKRADAIVKAMMQHSNTNTGTKELTDINALADEYLRLSYHGIRAKDKSSNTEMKTDFDNSIGKINIIPQDIGRVLLNLYNNAFYACAERSQSTTNAKQKTVDENYKPLISVSTKKINDRVEIKVSDNGNGIPQNIVDKIFQPFFTTKPTGQGTGLGLSLSYDIIKAHGGEIKVETKEGEGSELIINLPTG